MSVDLEKLKKLAEAATQGEWLNDEGEITCGTSLIAQVMTPSDFPCAGEEEDGIADELEANAALIAKAGPSTILALLARLEAAERNLTSEIETHHDTFDKLQTSEAALRTLRQKVEKMMDDYVATDSEMCDWCDTVLSEEVTHKSDCAWAALAAEGGK